MEKNNKKKGASALFVCVDIVKRYNITAAYVMAQVAYHIIKHGKYDTAHIATANYTRTAKSTVIKYLNKFQEDGVLRAIKGVDFQRPALTFNYNSNETAQSLYHAYDILLNKKVKSHPDWVERYSLVMVDVAEIDNINLENMKAARARSLLLYKSMLIDRFASNKINNDNGAKLKLGKWSAIARLFGCSINTVKSILEELKANKLIKYTKRSCVIFCSYALKLASKVDYKFVQLKAYIDKNKRNNNTKGEHPSSQATPSSPQDIYNLFQQSRLA